MENIKGKYLTYRGKPLVREGQQICWGKISEPYVLVLGIVSTKSMNGKDVPDNVMIMIQSTSPDHTVVKSAMKQGLMEAFEYGSIWLENELKNFSK